MKRARRHIRRWFRRFKHTRAWLLIRLAVVGVAAVFAVYLVSAAMERG